MKTIGFLKIDWNGIKSVLIHSAWIAGLTVAFYWLGVLNHHDFGMYQTLAVWVIGSVSAFLKKLCEQYNVPVPTDSN